jgi:hypothetical protein
MPSRRRSARLCRGSGRGIAIEMRADDLWTRPTRVAAPQPYMISGDNWGTQPRRNLAKSGERTMCHDGAEVVDLQGESDRARAVAVCLPCRRSWVRVPSAAWKALQITAFLVPETLSVLRRRPRVRSPSTNLGKAPARKAVPAASSGRFARADQVLPEPGDNWGTEPSAPNDRRSDRGPGGTPPHGFALSA